MFGKHLKIVEQIAIVFIFAVVVPMSIRGFIINNIIDIILFVIIAIDIGAIV